MQSEIAQSSRFYSQAIKWSLAWFILVGGIGVFLRLFFVQPIPWDYTFIRHTHSHLAFMGWLFNVIFLMICSKLVPEKRWVRRIFLGMQLAILGMLFSFPFQGYGPVSIAFSTLHMVMSFIFIGKIWKDLNRLRFGSQWIKAGMIFMIFSSVGPLALGPLSALGYKQTIWYDLSIQYYLHFFYNGWFFFALMGLLAEHLSTHFNTSFRWMVYAMVPLYFSSVIIYDQSHWVRLFSSIGACGFIGSIGCLIVEFRSTGKKPDSLVYTIFGALILKSIMQLVINIPGLDIWVSGQRHLIIGFIHLTFLGILTPMVWLLWKKPVSSKGEWVYLAGFGLTEFVLFLSPFIQNLSLFYPLLLGVSVLLLAGISWIWIEMDHQGRFKHIL